MTAFADALVRWQRQHGRHNLPWQNTHDPYRIWLSEIMLQQTQVATVLPYYQRFLQTFPTVFDLSQAPLEAVLALWSGLGYYSRARNLHRAAQQVVQQYQGKFPNTAAQLQTLSGVGASTAAAIAAFCFGERATIFDANVQRVMARQFAYAGDISRAEHKYALLHLTQTTLPEILPKNTLHARMVAYTQGLMDLGSIVCKAKRPACKECPVALSCKAHHTQQMLDYPHKKTRSVKTTEHWWLLALCRSQKMQNSPTIWLQQRDSSGIWAGLYCFPVFTSVADMYTVIRDSNLSIDPLQFEQITQSAMVVRHVLTHKILYLHLVHVCTDLCEPLNTMGSWYAHWRDLGFPAPIRKWLQQYL